MRVFRTVKVLKEIRPDFFKLLPYAITPHSRFAHCSCYRFFSADQMLPLSQGRHETRWLLLLFLHIACAVLFKHMNFSIKFKASGKY